MFVVAREGARHFAQTTNQSAVLGCHGGNGRIFLSSTPHLHIERAITQKVDGLLINFFAIRDLCGRACMTWQSRMVIGADAGRSSRTSAIQIAMCGGLKLSGVWPGLIVGHSTNALV